MRRGYRRNQHGTKTFVSDQRRCRLTPLAPPPARVVAPAISDVPGDDVSVIGSGSAAPEASTRADALAVLAKYGIAIPASVARHLDSTVSETPKPGDPRLVNVVNILVATPQKSLEAAAKVARDAGLAAMILGNAIEGEARDVGIVHAGIARQCGDWGQPLEIPCVLISGGETTVTVRGNGRGGRNAEFLLSLGIAADGSETASWALAADDEDGIDCSETNAGAILTPDAPRRARQTGIDVKTRLADNDAYSVFAALDDLVVTGPTLTNINDFEPISSVARIDFAPHLLNAKIMAWTFGPLRSSPGMIRYRCSTPASTCSGWNSGRMEATRIKGHAYTRSGMLAGAM